MAQADVSCTKLVNFHEPLLYFKIVGSAKRAVAQNYRLIKGQIETSRCFKNIKNVLENKKSNAITSTDNQRAWETISCL